MSRSGRRRNYDRLVHSNPESEFTRSNAPSILNRSLKTNDLYERDFFFVTSDSTEAFSRNLVEERWKEFAVINDDIEESSSPSKFTDLKIMEMERSINTLIELQDSQFLKVVVFFSLIHNFYQRFSESLQIELYDLKSDLVSGIIKFQEEKEGMKRKSKITTSYQKFLVIELGISEAFVKKLISRYKKLAKKIFKTEFEEL